MRADCPERIDGAILRGLNINKRISFENCKLFNGDFRESELEGTCFEEASLQGSDFSDCNLDYADFSEGNLRKADLSGANMKASNFDLADLKSATLDSVNALSCEFNEARVMETSFEDGDLRDASFTSSNLRGSVLSQADLKNASLKDCFCEQVDFFRADLRESNLKGARLFEANFSDAKVDHTTEIGSKSIYEIEADQEVLEQTSNSYLLKHLPKSIQLAIGRNPKTGYELSEESLNKAILSYRDFHRIATENSLSRLKRQFSVREKHSKRKIECQRGNFIQWFKLSLSRHTMLYGESPKHVVRSSIITIGIFAIIYGFIGLKDPSTGVEYSFVPRIEVNPEATLAVLEYSISRFFNSPESDLVVSEGGQIIATLESGIGAFLIALFVFVLGRRATN